MSNFIRKHPVATKLIFLLFSLFIALMLGELLIRGVQHLQYIKPANRHQFEQYKHIYSDERDKDYVFGHQPNVNVKLEKGEYNFTFITNSDGLRETEDYNELANSVIFLGDSIVEGSSVENDETMDEVFEQETGMTALNFGVGSSNTAHQYYWLRSKYKPDYNTRLIVLGFCLNDFSQNIYLRYFDPSLGNWALYKFHDNPAMESDSGSSWDFVKTTVNNSPIKRSQLARFVYRSIRNIKQADGDLPPFRSDQVTDESKYYTGLYLNKIKEFASELDSEFIVVIFPQESQLTQQYEPGQKMQDALIKILEDNGIAYIDLFDVMKASYIENKEVRWYHDDTHPYKEGHRLIGLHLAKKLPELFPAVFE